MSGANSSSIDPNYSNGALPILPPKGPFTRADQLGNIIQTENVPMQGGKRRRSNRRPKTKTKRRVKTRRKRVLTKRNRRR